MSQNLHLVQEKNKRLNLENTRFTYKALLQSFLTTQDHVASHSGKVWAGPSLPLWVYMCTVKMKPAWNPGVCGMDYGLTLGFRFLSSEKSLSQLSQLIIVTWVCWPDKTWQVNCPQIKCCLRKDLITFFHATFYNQKALILILPFWAEIALLKSFDTAHGIVQTMTKGLKK
jgi:hypothetical protein